MANLKLRACPKTNCIPEINFKAAVKFAVQIFDVVA